MRADHGARGLAVDVEVTNVEVTHGTFDLVPRPGVDGAGESELGVVGDVERVFEVAGFDHRKDGPEDLFLRDARVGHDVGDDGGLDVISTVRIADRVAAVDYIAFAL